MAVPTGTQLRYDIVGDREDLADVIYRISPEDTVFMSMIGRGKSASTFHEWQTDALGAPDPNNAQLEGDDASFSTPSPTKRVGNYTQISVKTVATSGSALALPLAGRRSEEALQQAKRAAELKLDMETILLLNQAADAGGSDEPRKLAGLPVWLQTNVDKAPDGANSGHVSGAPTT